MHPLDNCILAALKTRQAGFAVDAGEACRFQPEVAPLAALSDVDSPASWDALAGLIAEGRTAGLFLWEVPAARGGVGIRATRPLVQMICEREVPRRRAAGTAAAAQPSASDARDLSVADADDMIALVKLTQPGPMERRTVELGHYLGVRDGAGRLVAMAGERVRLDGFTEISAVCTHPDHRGRGLAADLMTVLMRDVFARGEVPFLHVAADNAGAMRVYHGLGFAVRRTGHLAVVERAPGRLPAS